ncbi:cilia- and flagella-associated protein 43 isoform X2 [Daktulosphaira vitifoliae]|uniref:cilia- and flagella-associated protein 43 isoform X1 n=1 Tax=Daktulosphaira vitifoliae TaxID=58002 RepID=UPI0021AA8D64|nr:cilia- and flagella-associated protein 43 isoform X1 [Daktulosphaira vitifoliae]XP_050530955.1 cilia- and flagella-associated protein 43 isoform X2 [Daktulosphaira vitifoliae]
MFSSNEIVTSESLNKEKQTEQNVSEDKTENITECIAGTCFSTSWVKPSTVNELKFVSKYVIMFVIGKTLVFFDLETLKEELVMVDDKNNLPLNSIGCVDCCNGDMDIIAVAEREPMHNVVIFRYPDFKVLSILKDDDDPISYKSVSFIKTTYIIGLRDYPSFDFIIWAWGSQEKLLSINTGLIQSNQIIGLFSGSGHNVYLNQIEKGEVCSKLQIWTFMISSKIVYADKFSVKLPSAKTDICSSCWLAGGWFLFCDSFMDVYRVQVDGSRASDPEIYIHYDKKFNEMKYFQPLLSSFLKEFVLYTPESITRYKEVKSGILIKVWTIQTEHILESIVIRDNKVYGWTTKGALMEITYETQKILKLYGSKIKFFTFIKPTDQTIITINEQEVLQLWDATTGVFKNEFQLDSESTNLAINPLYYYVAVTFTNGKIELIDVNPYTNSLKNITKMVLCNQELSSVVFFPDSQNCIASVYSTGWLFNIKINLGEKCNIIREFHLEKRIIDINVVNNQDKSFVVILYKTHEYSENVGNNIVIYDSKLKFILQKTNTQIFYTSVSAWPPLSSNNLLRIALTTYLSKHIDLIVIDLFMNKILIEETIPLDHDLRDVNVSVWKKHCITFSYDGTYNLYEFDDDGQWKKIVRASCNHWQTGGIKYAEVNVEAQQILIMCQQGDFMCISFNKNSCKHTRKLHQIDTPILSNTETIGVGNEYSIGDPKRMTWEMLNKRNQLETSKIVHKKQIIQIKQEFNEIKTKLLKLFEKNLTGPENEKLHIDEFDLDEDYRKIYREKCEIERKEYQTNILNILVNLKSETDTILKKNWDSLSTKPKSLKCLEKLYIVNNYPINTEEQEIKEKAELIINKRIQQLGIGTNSLNLTSVLNYRRKKSEFLQSDLENLDDISVSISNNSESQFNSVMLLGSISHRLIDNIDSLNIHQKYYELNMAEDEIFLLMFVINRLKLEFNKLFDDTFEAKQRQLEYLKKSNDRIRVINNEFRLACKFEPTGKSPNDYEWTQYECTEQLVVVENYEVLAKPYISTSDQMLINADLVEHERIPQLLAVDNFKQIALIEMMDGVLEKKWEDELKKDIPKPKCMLNKKPEEYTEEDLRTIYEYEKAVNDWDDQRSKYREMLEDEQAKLEKNIKESIRTFDKRVFKLFQTKIKFESAIKQEEMKIYRLKKILNKDKQLVEQLQHLKKNIIDVSKMIEETNLRMSKTEMIHNSLINTIDTVKHKDSILNRRFKAEFPSKLVYEHALFIYNRRPKIQQVNLIFSPLVGYQFVNAIARPNDKHLTDPLPLDFSLYLDILKEYDDYKYVEDNKINIDKDMWNKICNYRRMKIESEFKIQTLQIDIIDKTNLLTSFERNKEDKTDLIEKLKASIFDKENKKIYYSENYKIQLVMKNSFIEINLSGHFNDFKNTTLVSIDNIEEANNKIKKLGSQKLSMLSNLLKYRRKCNLLEWKHLLMKDYKIKMCEHRFNVISSMKVTSNIIDYIKYQSKGINIAEYAQHRVENQLSGLKKNYKKQIDDIIININDLNKKINDIKFENKLIDEKISQTNAQLLELKKKISHDINEKLKLKYDKKIKSLIKRTQLMNEVQKINKDILILHTELELLLLKTYPTLYNH